MSERVTVRNPHSVPVEVPGYGLLGAGLTVSVGRSSRLRRAIEHGRLAQGTVATVGTRSTDYASTPVDDLQAEADRRKLSIEGSGAGGKVLKADLVAAPTADDGK